MSRPTQEAENEFRFAEQHANQAVLHLTRLQSGIPTADPMTTGQIIFELGLAVDDLARSQTEMARGLSKLAIAIRQVFDKR